MSWHRAQAPKREFKGIRYPRDLEKKYRNERILKFKKDGR